MQQRALSSGSSLLCSSFTWRGSFVDCIFPCLQFTGVHVDCGSCNSHLSSPSGTQPYANFNLSSMGFKSYHVLSVLSNDATLIEWSSNSQDSVNFRVILCLLTWYLWWWLHQILSVYCWRSVITLLHYQRELVMGTGGENDIWSSGKENEWFLLYLCHGWFNYQYLQQIS